MKLALPCLSCSSSKGCYNPDGKPSHHQRSVTQSYFAPARSSIQRLGGAAPSKISSKLWQDQFKVLQRKPMVLQTISAPHKTEWNGSRNKSYSHIKCIYSSSCGECGSKLGGSLQIAGVVNSIRYSQRLGSEVDSTAVSFPQMTETWKTKTLYYMCFIRGEETVMGSKWKTRTDCGGSVRTLPAACSMFILHHRVDVIFRTCPFPPRSAGNMRWRVQNWAACEHHRRSTENCKNQHALLPQARFWSTILWFLGYSAERTELVYVPERTWWP